MAFGIISSILGARSQKKAADAQYKYDISNWNYQWDEANRDYQWRLQENSLLRRNINQNARFQNQTAQRQYQYDLAIREFDFQNQMRQYQESERIYGLQLGFNSQASQVAYEAENRKFEETLAGMAFEQQDMLVKMLQEEGQLQAMGTSGRSAGKALASAMASYGRNQAIMAESLVSAKKENKVAMRQIDTEKYGADLAAHSRRMLQPVKGPTPPAPLKVPRAAIMDPRAPVRPPKPVKGAKASVFGSALTGLTSDIGLVSALLASSK